MGMEDSDSMDLNGMLVAAKKALDVVYGGLLIAKINNDYREMIGRYNSFFCIQKRSANGF